MFYLSYMVFFYKIVHEEDEKLHKCVLKHLILRKKYTSAQCNELNTPLI